MTQSHQLDRTDPVDDLVKSVRSDRKAFGQLFDQFYPPIFSYCSRRLIVRAVAEDVTSEIFVKVAASIQEFPGNTAEDFRRWLFRIATNEINAHLRQTIRRRELLESAVHLGVVNAGVSTVLTDSESPVEWSEVYQALGKLSDQEQSVISLRFFGGLKHDQIADVLKIKTGMARTALSRALEKLRESLRDAATTRRSEKPDTTSASGKIGGN